MNAKHVTNSRFAKLLQPVVDAIAALGGSARPSEVKEWIIQNKVQPQGYLDLVHKGSGESVFGNDVDWARYYLVKAGIIDASTRGVWSLTDSGRSIHIDSEKATEIVRNVDSQMRSTTSEPSPDPEEAESGFLQETLAIIKTLPPTGFERLCQRLLRESGFEEVHVLGRSGDGGIDGQGILTQLVRELSRSVSVQKIQGISRAGHNSRFPGRNDGAGRKGTDPDDRLFRATG